MMEHGEVQKLLPAYLDQELGIIDALAVERHLETCAECGRELDEQRSGSMRTRDGAAYFDAPPSLRAHIVAALPAKPPPRMRQAWLESWWPQAVAAISVLLALAWGVSTYRAVPSPQQRLTEELVASHVRSLQVDHLADIASSDQHTVKPWFIGKVNFAPPVTDLTPQGFPLVGGRLDYLDGRDVAVLVYRRSRHPINLFIWPGAGLPVTPQTKQTQGYNLIRWSEGGMNFSAVSDVSEKDLAQFVALLRN
jgi:anti-sigma factor RsiW